MEAIYELGIGNRMRAVLSAKNPEKQIYGTGAYSHILVQVAIPNEHVLQFSNIEVDQNNRVIFSGTVYKPRLDDDGRVEVDTQIGPGGHVYSSSCKVMTYPVYPDELVRCHLINLIDAGQLNEPVDLGTIFSEMMTWKKIIDDAQPLVDAAERDRLLRYTEQERQKAIAQEQKDLAAKQKVERELQDAINRDVRRKSWIENHGSDMLKVAVGRGYECNSRFLKEWGCAMLGLDYLIDFKGDVTTQPRTCPSDEALAEILRLETINWSEIETPVSLNIVWLPHGDDELRGWGSGDSACEAVEVALSEPYFDRKYYFYRLFKV
jgi:hypothetical protein